MTNPLDDKKMAVIKDTTFYLRDYARMKKENDRLVVENKVLREKGALILKSIDSGKFNALEVLAFREALRSTKGE